MKIEKTLNPLPALTWNWLRMNRAKFEEETSETNKAALFDAKDLPKEISFAQGQKSADIKEIPTGLGKSFDELLDQKAAPWTVLELPQGFKSQDAIVLRARLDDGQESFERLLIKAGDNAEATIAIEWSSEEKAKGINALQTKIVAGDNCKIRVSTIQLLGQDFVHLNDIGTSSGENSLVDISQLELGAQKIYQGIRSTLTEYNSFFKHNMAYCLDKDRELDMNFVADQFGKKSKSDMNVYGTLTDSAKKTYRGTIDFKRGCKGAEGNEQEDTLLLSPDVVNKSIPLILCDEEEVQGEHGATIGRLDESLLFYMKSRAIDLENAQKMMARSKIARVAALLGSEEEAKKALDFFDAYYETEDFNGGEE